MLSCSWKRGWGCQGSCDISQCLAFCMDRVHPPSLGWTIGTRNLVCLIPASTHPVVFFFHSSCSTVMSYSKSKFLYNVICCRHGCMGWQPYSLAWMYIEYTLAPLPQTNRGEGIKLGKDPKGKNFVYTNGKSVFIRDIEVGCYHVGWDVKADAWMYIFRTLHLQLNTWDTMLRQQ